MNIHFILPQNIDDPARPSGGNVYDRRLIRALTCRRWSVREHAVPGDWPHPDAAARERVAATLAGIGDGAVVVLDGLVGSVIPEVLVPHAGRLRIVMLVHMLIDDEREAAALDTAALVLATSQWTRRRLRSRYGLAADRVHVATPGVDVARATPVTSAGSRLLCAAAVTHHKGHDVLAAALGMVADLPWTCECAGSLDREPSFVDTVRRMLSERGIADRVGFPGALPAAAIADRYERADLLVLASRTETYGMVVTEALARGIPVVATDTGGLPEALGGDGVLPGLLVPPDDPAALATALRRWLTQPGLRARLRAAAGARRTTLYRWDLTAQSFAVALSALDARAEVHSG